MDLPGATTVDAVGDDVQLTEAGIERASNVSVAAGPNFEDSGEAQAGGSNVWKGSDSGALLLDLGLPNQDEFANVVSVNETGDRAVGERTALEKDGDFESSVESVKEGTQVVEDTLDGDSGPKLASPVPTDEHSVKSVAASHVRDGVDGNLDGNVDIGEARDVSQDLPRLQVEPVEEVDVEEIGSHSLLGRRGLGTVADGLENNEVDASKAMDPEGPRQTAQELSSTLVEGHGEASSPRGEGDQLDQISELSRVASVVDMASSASEEDTDSEEDGNRRRKAVSTAGGEDRLRASMSITLPPSPPDSGVLSAPKRKSSAEGFVALDQLATVLANRSPTPKSILAGAAALPVIATEDYDTNDDQDSLSHDYTGLPQDEDIAFANSELTWEGNAWQPRSSLRDEQFFDVSLKENSDAFAGVDAQPFPLQHEDGGLYPESYMGVAQEDVHDDSPDFTPKGSSHSAEMSTLSSAASFNAVGLYPPFLGPTEKPNRMAILPDASPELMHLIEAAVQGTDSTSLETLRGIVSGQQRLTRDSDEKVPDAEGFEVEDLSREATDVARVVVDILLAKMAGTDELDIEGHDSTPRIMLSAGASIVAGKLLPWLPTEGEEELFAPPLVRMSPRTRLAKGLALVLQSCTRNRAMCSAAGLIHVLLCSTRTILMSEIEDDRKIWNTTALLEAIESLGSHSLTVKDLREWLGTITDVIQHEKSLDVLLALERAISGEEARGPSYTFEFDGESSGLLGPGESRWPFVNGYAFVTWLYIESFADPLNTAATAAAIAAAAVAKTGRSSPMSAAAAASALAGEGTAHMPRLFSFLSADNQGFEAYFHGQFLVVESVSGKGKKASLHFTFAFKPQQWYFVGLEHTYKQALLGKADSEVRLYVNGRLYESRPLEFPRISKSLGFCCVGTNPPPAMAGLQRRRRQCPLFAEMGPIYIFKEPIGLDRMGRLAARGGDVVSSFGSGAGVPWLANNEQAMATAEESAALDVELAPRLHLLYHPKLLVGRSCPDASPSGASGIHRRPADVLGHVHVAVRTRPTEAIWAMAEGGPMALLPLTVGSVDKDSLQPVVGDVDISSTAALLAPPVFRILSVALQHPGNAEELARTHAPQLLANLLGHLVSVVSWREVVSGKKNLDPRRVEERHEELVAAVVSVAQAPRNNAALKLQLYSSLLLDLKLWSRCAYGLQKKLLSTLADMVFTEAVTMRGAAAVQMLLDGCRRCYWMVPESNSIHMFAGGRSTRSIGEVNALVDELLVIIELLVGSAQGALAVADVRSLVQFVLDCPQPNQVARVLHLIYRLVVQPNVSRAAIFAEMFLANGGVEMLLKLLQREAETGELGSLASDVGADFKEDSEISGEEHILEDMSVEQTNINGLEENDSSKTFPEATGDALNDAMSDMASDDGSPVRGLVTELSRSQSLSVSAENEAASFLPAGKIFAGRKLGGIALSIRADSAKNNFRNVDSGDGIMVGIVSLLGALIAGGYLRLSTAADSSQTAATPASGNIVPTETTAVSGGLWLLYALQRSFQAAPKRLLTHSVYGALLPAVVRSEVGTILSEDQLALYDSGHRFEHIHLLLVLLQCLPHAPRSLQLRTLQDMLLLACSHPDNRMTLTKMAEWPDWLLELLISNCEVGPSSSVEGMRTFQEITDFIYSFLSIMLEHSMRLKDGWKDVEGVIHCAEWLALIGGSSTGDQRLRREESLPVIKRKILGALLDFAAGELQLQTQVVATAAAGVAAGGLSPRTAKAEAEAAAQLSMFLAENALVLLMLVEDHLRLQCQAFSSGLTSGDSASTSKAGPFVGSPFLKSVNEFPESPGAKKAFAESPFEHTLSRKLSNVSEPPGGVSLEVLASMADASGQISALAMERLAASSAAEPFESVRCAFVSYGSTGTELAAGWKRRSHMWYGVGLPTKGGVRGGGAGGWEIWKKMLERDTKGEWVDLTLVKKSVNMLQALLLDDSGPGGGGGGGIGFGGGAGTGSGGVQALQQLLDSDQPFFAMLRIVLLSTREEDKGENVQDGEIKSFSSEEFQAGSLSSNSSLKGPTRPASESIYNLTMRRAKSSLLWCVLAPLLTMPLSESRRQRVLVAVCIIYSEIWHAVSDDGKILRRQYLEAIVPPFAALLRRWRPLLSGIHELTDAEGQSPLAVEDRALASDAVPSEAGLAFLSPAWAAAFASPPAAMALAMAAAGVGGGDAGVAKSPFVKHEADTLDRRASRLRSFSSLKLPDSPKAAATPKDKASAKAAALAAARDQERAAKIGSGRGLGAVAMATSAQRRSIADKDRAKRWNLAEAMGTAWQDCSTAMAGRGHYFAERDWNVPGIKVLGLMVETAMRMQAAEIERHGMVAAADEYASCVGVRVWRSLIRRLLEMRCPVGPITKQFASTRIFWRLDNMENSLRMRQRIKRNYKGTDHRGEAADHKDSGDSAELQVSDELQETPLPAGAPKLVPEQQSILEEATDEELVKVEQIDPEERRDERNVQLGHTVAENVRTEFNLVASSVTSSGFHSNTAAAAMAAMVAEPKEKILLDVPAAMVQPSRVLRGRFKVTTRRICFIVDDRVHIDDAGVASFHDEEEDWEQVVFTYGDNPQRRDGAKDRLWPLSALREMQSRRYLLRRSALELFMVDRSNYFFNFGTTDGRQRAHRALVQARPPHLNSIYAGTQRPERLLKKAQLSERWARREISNFEYLMQLNTLAGRTYNDMTQYPVFPWVLADYTSENLDLGDSNVYRDLSKPIGALNHGRLEKFLERYENFDDPVIPKFHYGSHYSSAGTVLYYLMRMEPYATLAIQLQGGKFDHADRMFGDIGSTWAGVLEDMSDVKELVAAPSTKWRKSELKVPELFYLPEILKNENNIDFGSTQKGERIGDVKLPPWAANPVDFVQKHRAALESEYVSAHLHKWIDLIFGYKQRGKEAIAANNVFFYMTYEGTVDIDKITDPVLRKATQDQITYFGQTPSQLLTTPHVKRWPLERILQLQTIFRNPKDAVSYVVPTASRLNVPACQLRATPDSIVTVDMDAPACHVAVHRWQPNTPDGRGLPFLFHHAKLNTSSSSGALLRMFRGQPGSTDEHLYPRVTALTATGINPTAIVAVTPDGRHLLTGGHADNSLKLVATDTARVIESAFGHCAPITCLSLSPDGSTLLTGSRDCTAILWRVHGNAGAGNLGFSSMSDPSLVAAAAAAAAAAGSSTSSETADLANNADGKRRRVEGPLHVLRGHIDELNTCCVNADLDLAVSSSHRKGVLLHSITRGRFLRQLPVDRADIVAISREGVIAIWDERSRSLQTYTVNGVKISGARLPGYEGRVTSLVISSNGLHIVIGTSWSRSLARSDTLPRDFEPRDYNPYLGCPQCKGQEERRSKQCTHDRQLVRLRSQLSRKDSTKIQGGALGQIESPLVQNTVPSLILARLQTLEVIYSFILSKGQDVTAMALNRDDTNLLVSTANAQLLLFTDPALSIRVVDQMLRLGWEGGGLAGYV